MNQIADHLWQSTLFAGVVWLLTLALRTNRARVRHGLWLAASLKFLIPFSVLIALGGQIHLRKAAATVRSNLYVVVDQVTQPFTAPAVAVTAPSAPSPLPAILLSIWASGFIGITISWWVRWHRIRRAVRAGSPLHLEVPIKALSSPILLEPGVFGIFRPVLLLPDGIFDRLSPAQLQAVIAHELCHVRHRDNLIATIHMFVETVFWFHPLVWWIGKRMVEERERACDEEVLRKLAEPKAYAEGILNVCKLYVESPLRCVSGVTGPNLKKRIEAIMTNPIAFRLNFAKKAVLAAAGFVALTAPIAVGVINAPFLHAQSQQPAFEVATIKPNVSGSLTRFVHPTPGRLTISNMTVRDLVAFVYRVRDFQISGGPDWVNSSHYDIEAKAEGDPSQDQLKLMLGTLLRDRFRLALHHDTRELQIYALTVSKSGLKLQPLKEGDCIVFDHTHPPTPGQKSSNYCGNLSNGRGTFDASSATMAEVATMFSYQVGRTVVDKTGLTGKFPVHLKFAPEDVATGAPSTDDLGPSIFTAVQEQLGLKLESAKGPVDILVIDRAEKPSEN